MRKNPFTLRPFFFSDTVYPTRIDPDKVLPVWAVLLLWILTYGIVLLLRIFLRAVLSASLLWISGGDVEAADHILAGSVLEYPLLYLLLAIPLIALPLFYEKQHRLSRGILGLRPDRKKAPLKLLSGFLGGILLFAVVQTVILLFPDTRFSFLGFSGGRFFPILFSVLALAASCLGEELLFRGFLFSELCPRLRLLPALCLQAVLFSLVHVLNPYISVTGMINTFLFGLAAGCLAYLSKDILLPFAVHFGWNASAMHLFGSRLSGMSPYSGSLFSSVNLSAVSFLHGGNYGPEGSLPCLILLGLLVTCLLLRIGWREHRKP